MDLYEIISYFKGFHSGKKINNSLCRIDINFWAQNQFKFYIDGKLKGIGFYLETEGEFKYITSSNSWFYLTREFREQVILFVGSEQGLRFVKAKDVALDFGNSYKRTEPVDEETIKIFFEEIMKGKDINTQNFLFRQLIAIDPSIGKEPSYAIMRDGKITAVGKIQLPKNLVEPSTRIITEIAKLTYDEISRHLKPYPTAMAIEGQYLGHNAAVMEGLVEVRAAIAGYFKAKMPYIAIFTVPPNIWQANILGPRIVRAKSEKRKMASIKYAAAYLGDENTDSDLADALCLLKYLEIINVNHLLFKGIPL